MNIYQIFLCYDYGHDSYTFCYNLHMETLVPEVTIEIKWAHLPFHILDYFRPPMNQIIPDMSYMIVTDDKI